MSLILNIDTALDIASICLSKNEESLQLITNENQKDHAAWLHPAIAELFDNDKITMKDLAAVAVTIGPGSYTGLRVGLATAKGLCYAMNIPLITVGTLEMIAFAAREQAEDLICPVIDARRAEVFTAVYNKKKEPIISPRPLIVDEKSFEELLSTHQILFCGNGSKKLQKMISNSNARFTDTIANAAHLAHLSHNLFLKKIFADLAYVEPLYLKEFYSPDRKSSP